VATDYIVRLKCPYGDRDQLLILENRQETLKQILETAWDFECPVHGVQREHPLEGHEKALWASAKSQPAKSPHKEVSGGADKPLRRYRSSKRISIRVPVSVSGRSKDETAFREETTTLLVNAGGGLLLLNAGVAMGDTVNVANKQTRQEQLCRVAHLERDLHGKQRVGVAFHHPTPQFWRAQRRETRLSRRIRVRVRGADRSGQKFVQKVCVLDVSRHGARVEDIGYLTKPGDTIEVRRYWQTARYRVAWIGATGTPQAGQVGVIALDPEKNIWGVDLP
jgi:hypothetical protein